MKNKLRGRKGFTLTEIIVAIAILGIIAVSFMSMFTFGFITMISGNRTSVAQQFAKDAVEGEMGNPMVFLEDGTYDSSMVAAMQIEFQGNVVTVSGADVEFNNPYVDAHRVNRSVELVTFVPQRIFLSDYSVTLNGSSSSITVNVYAANMNDLTCRVVRPDSIDVSSIVTLTNNIGTNGSFTLTGGNASSTDQKTRVLVQSALDPNVHVTCTIINY